MILSGKAHTIILSCERDRQTDRDREREERERERETDDRKTDRGKIQRQRHTLGSGNRKGFTSVGRAAGAALSAR